MPTREVTAVLDCERCGECHAVNRCPQACPCCEESDPCLCHAVEIEWFTGVVAPDGYKERDGGLYCLTHHRAYYNVIGSQP